MTPDNLKEMLVQVIGESRTVSVRMEDGHLSVLEADDGEIADAVIRVVREYLKIPHNHVTRDIKNPGECPGCDSYWWGEEEKNQPPVYLAADLWQALGAPISDFDAYYERNGWADTWANLLGAVRDHFRPKCGQDIEGEPCVLSAGHLPPHYGSSDVGSSEPVPVPVPKTQSEPSDAQVLAALNVYNDDLDAELRDWSPYKANAMRAALRAAGGVR